MAQVKLYTNGLGGQINTQSSGTVFVSAAGTITVNAADVPDMLRLGCTFVMTQVRRQYVPTPAAASATGIVSNVTTANGALTIAAQPGVGRQLAIVTAPGSPGITAGTLTMVYVANDGTTTTDVFSLIGATTTTPVTTKGVLTLTSATVAGLVGGTSPTIEVGTNAVLALPIDKGDSSLALLKETLDGSDVGTNVGTLAAYGLYTPHTAPNGTHTYMVDYAALAETDN